MPPAAVALLTDRLPAPVLLAVKRNIHNKPNFFPILLRLVENGMPKSVVSDPVFALAPRPLAFCLAVMR